ncbi:MAG: MalY/PatB family protein [Candidatus Promineifilaceae bacterium]
MTDKTIYNFDQELDRTQNGSSKWGYMFATDQDGQIQIVATDRFTGPNRTLPLWVADMDFIVPKPVIEALAQRAIQGTFGYTSRTEAYDTAVINWMQRHYGLTITAEDFSQTPGVVAGLVQIINTFTEPGDGIIIQTPVYFPFYSSITNNGREIVENPLINNDGYYTMDFDDLAQRAKDPNTKMIILCSPHNPIGRVWTADELRRLGEICNQNDVLVVSDEVHCDLILNNNSTPGNLTNGNSTPVRTFTNYATLGPEFAQNAVVCNAGSKTFNLAGLKTSNIIIPNPDLHARFKDTLQNSSISHAINLMGMLALQTAYEEGENWLEQLLVYLSDNCNFLADYLEKNIPEIKMRRPEGTYLAWLDCSRLNLEAADLHRFFLEEANVYLEAGDIFGEEGAYFMRLNFACPRSILQEALERINRAVKSLK